MSEPLISVIIPVYNIIDCLPRCVESVCRQTYRNLEILLVDDGSTDGTGQLCDSLGEEDERIRVFHKKNGGSSSARNLGIRESRGAYLGFVDSDDYIEPDMYERLYAAIVKSDAQIAQIGRNEIDAAGEKLPDICMPPAEEVFISSKDFLRELLLHRGDCSFCTKLIKRELFLEEQFPVGVLNEDFFLLTHMLQKTQGIYSIPGYGYHVFYRIGSNTRKEEKDAFSRVYADCVDNADMVYSVVRENYPDLVKVAIRFGLYQRLMYLLHIPIVRMQKSNSRYRECVSYIRKHMWDAVTSPYLTGKNKIYLLLLGSCPKGVRMLHAKIKKL
ncbi:MAG: glycosyltransferase family 2 protein [Lachnospiraceae bacterium]